MKISFLIPSKNRLELLRYAIDSIRGQVDLDYEIVVTDNSSDEDYQAYITELNDPRVIYERQPTAVSVTENWQASLDLATGDYILMLGDDDALAPAFGPSVTAALADRRPDIVYVAAFHYCYPNVIPGSEPGYLASVLNSEFLQDGRTEPFVLPPGKAEELAIALLDLRHRFGTNAQHFLIKRSFAKSFECDGGLYQGPYPDTFSSVAAFIHADEILVIPQELVLIGISPKSFGAFYFSGRHDDGYVFLANMNVSPEVRDQLQQAILPGDRNDANWLISAEEVRRKYPERLGASVNTARYRALQMVYALRTITDANATSERVEQLRAHLREDERYPFLLAETAVRAAFDLQPPAPDTLIGRMTAALGQYHPAKVTFVDIGPHATILDAVAYLATHEYPLRGT